MYIYIYLYIFIYLKTTRGDASGLVSHVRPVLGEVCHHKTALTNVRAGGVLKGAQLSGGYALPMVVSDGDLTQSPVVRCREAMPTN